MSSSREARSARREALKSKLASCNIGKVTKKAKKVSSKKSLSNSVDAVKHIDEPVENNGSTEPIQDIPGAEISAPSSTETATVVPEEASVTEQDVDQQPKEELRDVPILNTTDDELEAYVQEFEETSLGACPPEPLMEIPSIPSRNINQAPLDYSDFMDVPQLDDERIGSPETLSKSSPSTPISPSSPSLSSSNSPSTPTDESNSIDEYITYDADAETSPPVNYTSQKRGLKSLYKFQPSTQTFHNSFNPNNRTLMAAWYTMAQDCLNGPREAYIHSVLLAAASLNQRSMLSGGARQTMSPGMSS